MKSERLTKMIRIRALYVFIIMLTSLSSGCEKINSLSCRLEAPADLTCGLGGGNICAVYHYAGGMSLGATVYLHWNEVANAEGYILYVKLSESNIIVKDTTTTPGIAVSQGSGRITYLVTAYSGDCESDYSSEYSFTVH
jgi:hypothetical protein